MAEYITKKQALEIECEKCPVNKFRCSNKSVPIYDCLFHCSSYNAINNLPTADVVKRSTMEILCNEYLSKCDCCDECCAEYFCIENQLRTEKRDCVNNLITYFIAYFDERNIGE